MNQNQVQTGNLVRQAADGDASASNVYRAHQRQLLYREARRQSIARWLGIDNSTNPYLASKYYPDVANGSAPVLTNGTGAAAGRGSEDAYRVPTFVPESKGELAPVHSLVTDLFASHDLVPDRDHHHPDAPLHLQNLTGFTKGSWQPLPYSYADLGLNETWVIQTGRAVTLPSKPPVDAPRRKPENATTEVAQALAAEPALGRRQHDTETTMTSTGTPDGRNETEGGIPETVTYNRTLQRGTFPWIERTPLPPGRSRSDTHRATFNLRSLQTSATGPVLREQDSGVEGQLLRVKDLPVPATRGTEWQDWERLGPVVYVGGKLTLHAPPRSRSGEEQVTELDVEAVQCVTRITRSSSTFFFLKRLADPVKYGAHALTGGTFHCAGSFLDSGRIFGYATPEFARARIVETISLPVMSSTSGTASSASPNLTAIAIGYAMLKEYDLRLERDVKRLANADEVEPPPTPPSPPPSSSAGGGGDGRTGAPPDDDTEEEIVPRCIFTLYGALSPLPRSYTRALYAEWYSNLFYPTGARVSDPPPTTLSAVLASPNCGLVLSVPAARVTPTQELWNAATSSGAGLVAIEATILLLQVRQLERVQGRPGTIAHVSHYGVVGMLFVDAYAFVTLLTLGVVFGPYPLPLSSHSIPTLVPNSDACDSKGS